jgi:hypothetical protein
MLTALVLICSVAVTPDLRDCTRDNATAVMRVPADFGTPVTCFLHGQAYLAGTEIGQELGNDDRVKLICARIRLDRAVRPDVTGQVSKAGAAVYVRHQSNEGGNHEMLESSPSRMFFGGHSIFVRCYVFSHCWAG